MLRTDASKVVMILVVLFALDLLIIGGILFKGHANFTEVYKHL
jgi:hypothetical protein